jgi:tripartite-type tricarboxylate transporter receptor subunit TctC
MHMHKLLAAAIRTLALASLATMALAAAAWPQGARAIRIIMSVPAGGSIDVMARILADHVSATKGQPIIVESRPGAGGVIAAEAVARAPPDGATLLINNNGMIINAILRKVSYDPKASFEPICNLVTTPQLIVVNRASPYRTLVQLVEAARARPAEVSIASVGPNTTQHVGIERLKRLAQVNLTYVPYPGGAPAVNALLGGHVSSAVLNWSEIAEQWAAGNVRALATMASRRIDPLPDLPTVAESGYKDFETDVWFGLVAPAGTPQETVSQLIDWFGGALAAPEVKSKLTAQALYPIPVCGGDFAAHIGRQIALYTRLLRELNFKM